MCSWGDGSPESASDPFVFPRSGPWRSSRCRVASFRRTTDFKTTQPLLVLLLPLPLDVELLLLAPALRCTCPFELVPGDRELVLDGDLVIHKHPLGGEGQISFLQFHVLEFRLLLVRPAHRPGELVPVLLDRQCGHPLLAADLVLALPRPDRVCLLALRARKPAEPEYQRRREDRFHVCLQEVAGGEPSNAERLQALTTILGKPRPPVRMARPSASFRAGGVARSARISLTALPARDWP